MELVAITSLVAQKVEDLKASYEGDEEVQCILSIMESSVSSLQYIKGGMEFYSIKG